MHRAQRPHLPPASASPAQRWVLWMLVQALLALTFMAGPRAIGGPLHAHDAGGDHAAHHGAAAGLARHVHDDDAGAVLLDQAAQAAEHLGSAGASAVATLWPLSLPRLERPRPGPDRWAAPARAVAWQDADTAAPEHRPRA